MAGDLPSDVFSGCWTSRAVMAKSLPPMASEKCHFNVHLTCDWSDSLHNQSTRHLLTSTLKMKTFQITPGERDDVSRRNIHSTARFFVFPPNTVEKSRSAASGMGKRPFKSICFSRSEMPVRFSDYSHYFCLCRALPFLLHNGGKEKHGD